jgi:hypothetical protein
MKRWKQFLWNGSHKNGHLTVDGPLLKRKAEEIATELILNSDHPMVG